jgi:hypothetical protein
MTKVNLPSDMRWTQAELNLLLREYRLAGVTIKADDDTCPAGREMQRLFEASEAA